MNKNLSYEEISKETKVLEDSEVSYHHVPLQNDYEKAKWNSNGYDQSGMK